MGYETLSKFIRNEKNPERYCLDYEYSSQAYMELNPIERYLTYKSTGVKVDKEKQSLSNICIYKWIGYNLLDNNYSVMI